MAIRKALALLGVALCGGCTSFAFEPTPNWWTEGGRACAANREDLNWPRAAPLSCSSAFADTAKTKREG
jgi:hypothetical protein